MYERILAMLDGSELAEMALPYAEQLAGRMGSEIILFSVHESAEVPNHHLNQDYIERTIKATKARAEKYLDKTQCQEIRVNSVTRVGYPAEAIVSYADKGGVELLVMATHGRSGISRWALGSVADKVIRATRQPVALIRAGNARPDADRNDIMKRALVPLDGSSKSEMVIPYVAELASRLGTELTLLQVVAEEGPAFQDAESYLQKVCRRLEDREIHASYEVQNGAVADKIINLADAIQADMVAMSTHGRSGISRWTLGSVAEKVLQGGNTPLLLVRTP